MEREQQIRQLDDNIEAARQIEIEWLLGKRAEAVAKLEEIDRRLNELASHD